MKRHAIVPLLLVLAAWPPVLARQKAAVPGDRARVVQAIHGSICWALTKDRALLERTMAHDADLFIFNPDSKATIGWDELAKNFALWMDPRFKAVTCDIRDLRVRFSRSGDVAWWSAILDDLAEWDGRPVGWRNARWTGVLEKRNRAWVIVQMHFSFAADKVREQSAASPAPAQVGTPVRPSPARPGG